VKRSPLTRKTPLRQVRPTQRRKGRAKPAKSAAEKRYHGVLAGLPCAVCGTWPVEVHHVRHDGCKGITRNHRLAIPLCPPDHRTSPTAVHRIGTPRFEALHGFSQIERARQLWEQYGEH
jgi:hypothetical protein